MRSSFPLFENQKNKCISFYTDVFNFDKDVFNVLKSPLRSSPPSTATVHTVEVLWSDEGEENIQFILNGFLYRNFKINNDNNIIYIYFEEYNPVSTEIKNMYIDIGSHGRTILLYVKSNDKYVHIKTYIETIAKDDADEYRLNKHYFNVMDTTMTLDTILENLKK